MGGVAHTDIAAYVLGVLDEEDNAVFEAHLQQCTHCQFDLLEFYDLPEILAEVSKYWPEPPIPQPRPLDGMFDELARHSRRRRIITRAATAAAVLLIIAGPLVTIAFSSSDSDSGAAAPAQVPAPVAASTATSTVQSPTSLFANGSEAGKSLQAQVVVEPTAWGSNINLVLSGVTAAQTCQLVAVPWAGPEQVVTSWTVPTAAPGSTANLDPLRISGGAGFTPAEIARFEIRTPEGEVLASVPR